MRVVSRVLASNRTAFVQMKSVKAPDSGREIQRTHQNTVRDEAENRPNPEEQSKPAEQLLAKLNPFGSRFGWC